MTIRELFLIIRVFSPFYLCAKENFATLAHSLKLKHIHHEKSIIINDVLGHDNGGKYKP